MNKAETEKNGLKRIRILSGAVFAAALLFFASAYCVKADETENGISAAAETICQDTETAEETGDPLFVQDLETEADPEKLSDDTEGSFAPADSEPAAPETVIANPGSGTEGKKAGLSDGTIITDAEAESAPEQDPPGAETGQGGSSEGDPEDPVEPAEPAAPLTIYNGFDYARVFDFSYYMDQYPELQTRFGAAGDEFGALQYFVQYGMWMQQKACADFDVQSYRNANPDLREKFRLSYPAYYRQYCSEGYAQNRKTSGVTVLQDPATVYKGTDYAKVYNYSYYLSKYPAVKNACGEDDFAALSWFVNNGMTDRHQASSSFDVRSYRNANPDLRLKFGVSWVSYYLHYINGGYKESRKATGVSALQNPVTAWEGTDYARVYNYSYYLNKYAAVKSACGTDNDVAVLVYFVRKGIPAQQQAIGTFDEVFYRYTHEDLRDQYGSDYRSYYLHYIKTGASQNRTAVTPALTASYTGFRTNALTVMYYRNGSKTTGWQKVGRDHFYFDNNGILVKNTVIDGFRIDKEGIRERIKGIVFIDPGHQRYANLGKEAVGPGSGVTKMKVTGGTRGVVTKLAEYQLALDVSLQLKKELESQGYKVYLSRTSNDVNISNKERAMMANNADADVFIRIHANSFTSSSYHGVRNCAAASNNPYLSKDVISKGQKLANLLTDYQCRATGQKALPTLLENDMTGINWAKMPTAIVEMGLMSNAAEDRFMADAANQKTIVSGLVNGINEYFRLYPSDK